MGKAFESAEPSDGVFTMVSAGGTEFVEDEGFFLRRSLFVTENDGFDVFLFRPWSRNQSSFLGQMSGNINEAIRLPKSLVLDF